MQTCRNLRSSCVFWRKLGKSNSDLFVIVGLGNPGKEYTASRHNAGYLAIDRLMDRYGYAGQADDLHEQQRTVREKDRGLL